MKVFIAYSAKAGSALEECHELEKGVTVAQALKVTNWYQRHPLSMNLPVGVHGALVSPDQPLQPNDRIEFYRPLSADPKTKRKNKVAKAKSKRGASKNK